MQWPEISHLFCFCFGGLFGQMGDTFREVYNMCGLNHIHAIIDSLPPKEKHHCGKWGFPFKVLEFSQWTNQNQIKGNKGKIQSKYRNNISSVVYGNNAVLVLNRTCLSSNNALLALNWRYVISSDENQRDTEATGFVCTSLVPCCFSVEKNNLWLQLSGYNATK